MRSRFRWTVLFSVMILTVLALMVAFSPAATPTPTSTPTATTSRPTATPTATPTPTKAASPTPTDQGRYGGVGYYPLSGDIPTVDPHKTTASGPRQLAVHILEKMFEYDENQTPQPTLVDTFKTSSDGLTWEFKFRQGLKFHDGTPVNSLHASKSLERFFKRDSYGGLLATFVDKVETPDDLTVVLRLKEPTGVMLDALARIAGYEAFIMPPAMYEVDPLQGAPVIVGTGPYKFVSYKAGDRAVLEKWPEYKSPSGPASFLAGERKAYLDRIELLIIPDFGARMAALETGALDFLGEITPDLRSRLESNPDLVVKVQERSPSRVGIWINHLKAPFSDPKVRRAVQMGVDPDRYLFALMGTKDLYMKCGTVMVCNSRWGGIRGEGDEIYYNAPDLEGAKKLLQEAGVYGTRINLIVPQGGGIGELNGLAARDYLASLGFDVDFQVLDSATYTAKRSDKAYVDTFLTIGNFTFGGISPLLQTSLFVNKFANNYQDTSGRMTQLLDQLARAGDDQARRRVMVEIQKQFYVDLPYIIIGDILPVIAYRADLKGIETTLNFGHTVTYNNAWKERN